MKAEAFRRTLESKVGKRGTGGFSGRNRCRGGGSFLCVELCGGATGLRSHKRRTESLNGELVFDGGGCCGCGCGGLASLSEMEEEDEVLHIAFGSGWWWRVQR